MSDTQETVEVTPPHHKLREYAQALLAKAEELGHDVQRDVVSLGDKFRVPKDVADAVVADLDKAAAKDTGKTPVKKTAVTPAAAVVAGATPGGADATS